MRLLYCRAKPLLRTGANIRTPTANPNRPRPVPVRIVGLNSGVSTGTVDGVPSIIRALAEPEDRVGDYYVERHVVVGNVIVKSGVVSMPDSLLLVPVPVYIAAAVADDPLCGGTGGRRTVRVRILPVDGGVSARR